MAGPELNNGGERPDKARLGNSMRVSPNPPIETFYPHHSGKFEEGSRRHFLELTTSHGFITRFMEHTAYTGVRGPRSILNYCRRGIGKIIAAAPGNRSQMPPYVRDSRLRLPPWMSRRNAPKDKDAEHGELESTAPPAEPYTAGFFFSAASF